jgi:DNA-binding MarR family transcriptional regulator
MSEAIEIPVPALLRHARTTYGVAMRRALAEAGFDDVPRNGMYIIGGLALRAEDVPLSQLVRDLRVSKQAAGQLVDTLVGRGYLERTVDAEDRRRLKITLTERGRAAAEVQAGARRLVDDALEARLGTEGVARLREGLVVLVDMGMEDGRVG